MDINLAPIFAASASAIYIALAGVAVFGLFQVILLTRKISEKKMSPAATARFRETVQEFLERRDWQAIAELCDTPEYWSRAVPQMILVAIEQMDRSPAKLRQVLAERFERDVVAELEYGASWINTVVKSAPMLGLLGTVSGMIQAFAKIADTQKTGGDPSALAGEISFALFTTALGLAIAIPLVIAGAFLHIRMGKLQDHVQDELSWFLDQMEQFRRT
ncbi:MotA/TolQ/ExbB proton channel family protein [Rubinisphaera margarita]|uniref:MotA/TolQ/ExbB proton channel family protein n=1 Tax=Rubinisphaera margarita TaxID=2909586 RepID=UPI001EE8A5B2|nr:MotA/TolQ/ExbB proton channel family protein [Rubinisphaera margarita]MCG6155797.1 MotA/TolQ/ExbB proton channel family protein [Rubinisphaera margarita]